MQTVTIKPFKLIGIAVKTTNEGGKASTDIAELWQQFLSEELVNHIPNKVDNEILSLYTDYQGDHTQPYTAILGCKVTSLNSIPDTMIGKSFEGGIYVKTTAKGDLTQGLIVNHWSKIFEMGLDRSFVADFEVFDEKAQNPSDAEVAFFVGVKNETNE